MAVEYAHFMTEYISHGHMRQLSDEELLAKTDTVHYIPHHGIWKTGYLRKRLRVVFDASWPTSTGYSLNDVLHSGPKLQTWLPSVLLRWRRHRIAFCADVQMMFRQIRVDERDVNLQRILWSANDSSPPKHFQLLTLCEYKGSTWPEAVPIIKNDRYVNDILSGADDVETARLRRDQLIGLMNAGCFPLKKWVSNEPDLLRDIPEDSRLRPTWRQISVDVFVSELGINWDPLIDCFHLTPPPMRSQYIKRSMLAALTSLFDPCG
ncbi:uncharacterized protein LOC106639253 [Copidosoma floridanum]|uniref:uncharacterized protein LOC106639253 n=1 Tax=Copidosoma floridanum TaxID=29053 RepID=UPI0006C9A26E|nr:uncharacterized protein LOC106639253 [Copidosoma floridanum]